MKDKSLFISAVIFLFVILIASIGLFTPLKIVLSPLYTALMIIYILNPFVSFMRKKGLTPLLSTTFVALAIILLVGSITIIIFPKAKDAIESIYTLITDFLYSKNLEISNEWVSSSVNVVYSTAKNIIKSSLSGIVGAVTAFYVLKDTDNIKKSIKEIIPRKLIPSFKILFDDIKSVTDSFFKGQLLVGAVLCFMVSLFLYALKIPYALGLGVIIGILDIIPYVGAFCAMSLILCVTLLTKPDMIIFVAIGLLLIQQVENHVITPKVSENTLNIHPAIVVPLLYVGSFGGFWGILLSLPIACVIKKLTERLIQSII